MELHHYLFASYIFVLICVLVFVCKYLFADVKRQRRLLDEKEKQLLDTFRTLEDAMDDYYTLVEEAKNGLEARGRELERRLLLTEAEPAEADAVLHVETPKKAPSKKTPKPPAPKQESRDENQLGFEQVFTGAVNNVSVKAQLHEKIIEMSKQGKSRAEIAKELKITQNEVELVTGMNKKPVPPESEKISGTM